MLVRWGILDVFTILPGEGRPALVEHASQYHVVAQTNAKAPGRALGEINKEMLGFHNFPVLGRRGSKAVINQGCVGAALIFELAILRLPDHRG
jgi:hypothetical protein